MFGDTKGDVAHHMGEDGSHTPREWDASCGSERNPENGLRRQNEEGLTTLAPVERESGVEPLKCRKKQTGPWNAESGAAKVEEQ